MVACRKLPGGSATSALPSLARRNGGGDHLAIDGEPRKLQRIHETRQLAMLTFQQLALGPDTHVEAGHRCRHRHVAVAQLRAEARPMSKAGQAPAPGWGSGRCREALWVRGSMKPAVTSLLMPPHMQAHAAAARAMRIDAICNRGGEPARRQRLGDERSFFHAR
jgi:hypothetical protein